MMYYNNATGRIIDSDEMVKRYGTDKAIPELGIYELTYQPDFVPFAFNPVNNGTYFPVQSNVRVEVQRLVKAGFTEAEAEALLG
jgi:hypothetical protein